MNKILENLQTQALGLGQAGEIERGNEMIAEGEAHKQFLEATGLYKKKEDAYKKARSVLAQKIGETRLQSIEQITPPIYKAGREITKRTGFEDYIAQKQERGLENIKSARDSISEYLDSKTPDFIRRFSNRTDPRYKPNRETQPIESIPDENNPTDPPPPRPKVVEKPDPVIEKYTNDATYHSILNKVQGLSPEGQSFYDKKAAQINEGHEHPIDFNTGELDSNKLSQHADALVDAGNMFGFQPGLRGSGPFAEAFKDWWREKLNLSDVDKRYEATHSISQPNELEIGGRFRDVSDFYKEADLTPVLNPGENETSFRNRTSAIARESAPPQLKRELYNPTDEPTEASQFFRLKGFQEIDPDKRPGGLSTQDWQSKSVPDVPPDVAQQLQRERDEPREAALRARIDEITSRVKPPPRPTEFELPESAPGFSLLRDVLTDPSRGGAKPSRRQQLETETPQQLGAGGKTSSGPVQIQEPIESEPQVSQEFLENIRSGMTQKARTEPTTEPKESGTSMLGGYGLEAGFAAATVGELADPLATAKQKMKQVGETGAVYLGAKLGSKALEATGSKVGLGEVMTGVETAQDLFDKNLSASEKAKKVSGALGSYTGAMAAESLVPGLGELAMLGTGLTELGVGLRKEFKEKKEMEKQQAQDPARPPVEQTPQVTQAISFDNAPVIDSSNYHTL